MSPKTVSDVLEEVWEANRSAEVVRVGDTTVLVSWMNDPLRARVVACAPEALLLLDHVAHAFEADTELTVTGTKAAELYDRIDALLRKAGLR